MSRTVVTSLGNCFKLRSSCTIYSKQDSHGHCNCSKRMIKTAYSVNFLTLFTFQNWFIQKKKRKKDAFEFCVWRLISDMFDRNLFMLGVLACHRSSMCSVFGALCFVHICTDLKKKLFKSVQSETSFRRGLSLLSSAHLRTKSFHLWCWRENKSIRWVS